MPYLMHEPKLTETRYSDFLHGLSTTSLSSVADTSDAGRLAPSDRLRLIHDYITSTTEDGGLGIITGLPEWDRVDSIMALQDHEFNHDWIRTWSTRNVGLPELDKLRDQVRFLIRR
jgi:anoctamin-10